MQRTSRHDIDFLIGKLRAEEARLQAAMVFASPPLSQRAREAIAINAQLTEPETMEALKHGLDVGYGPAIQNAALWMVTVEGQVDTMRIIRKAITG